MRVFPLAVRYLHSFEVRPVAPCPREASCRECLQSVDYILYILGYLVGYLRFHTDVDQSIDALCSLISLHGMSIESVS